METNIYVNFSWLMQGTSPLHIADHVAAI